MPVTLEIKDDIALITMDDGDKNVVTLEVLSQLSAALDQAEADAKAVVLAGRPGSFCAGFDLSIMTGSDVDAMRALSGGGGSIAVRLYSYPKAVVAACTGHGFTIGAIWMMGCDNRIGEQGNYKLGLVETKMGLVLPGWATEPFKERLSPRYFVPVVVQSVLCNPETALEANMLDELVPSGKAVDRALAVATELAKLPGDAYAGIKLSTRAEAIEKMKASLAAGLASG